MKIALYILVGIVAIPLFPLFAMAYIVAMAIYFVAWTLDKLLDAVSP